MEEQKQAEKQELKIIERDGGYWTEDGRLLHWKLTEEDVRRIVEANPREAEFYRREGIPYEWYAQMVAEF